MATQQQQYPPMQYGRSRNPFGELTHSGYVPTYVGLPIDRMKETADKLETNYNTAIANKNKTEVLLAQMDIDSEDEQKRTNALLGFEQELAGYKEKGNWEDAQIAVANSTKNIAVNSGLITALKSKKQKELQLAAFKAQVANRKALPKDLEFRKKQADALYKEQGGVYFDETTGSWVGMWDAMDIPEVQNIGEKANKFLTNYKADTWIGLNKDAGYVKKVDPVTKEEKWYRASDLTVDEGIYSFKTSTEEVTLEEVSIAAHKQMLQDPFIDTRLEFTAVRDNFNIVTESERRGKPQANTEWAMKWELKNIFGENPNTTDRLSAEETALLWYKHVEIAKGIEASASKASYEKQIVDNVGLNADEIKRRERVKNAGSEENLIVKQTIQAFRSGAMKTANGIKSITKYIDVQKAAYSVVDSHQKTIDNIKAEMTAALAADPDVDLTGYKQQLSSVEMQKEIALYDVKQNEKLYNEAIRNAEYTKGAPVETSAADIVELNKNTHVDIVDAVNNYKSLLQEQFEERYAGSGWNSFEEFWNEQVFEYGKQSAGLFGTQPGASLGTMIGLKPNDPNYDEIKMYENAIQYSTATQDYEKYFTELDKIYIEKANDDDLVSAELKKQWDNTSFAVPILDLSTEDKSGTDPESTFTKRGTHMIRNNPGAFGVFNALTGEKEDWDTAKGDGTLSGGLDINFNKLTLIGPTMDYIHGVGYGYKAVETTYNEDSKPSSGVKTRKEVIIYEKPGTTSLSNLTLDYLKKGDLMQDIGGGKFAIKGTGKKGYDQVNDYAAKRVHEQVEKQLSWFQKFPAVYDPAKGATNKETIDVFLTPDRRAKVTRILQPNNSISYEMEVFEYNQAQGNKGNVIWDRKRQGGYTDLYDVENVLEHFAGFSNNYEVPLGSLEKISSSDLQYAEVSNSVITSPSSAPYLTAPMRTTFIQLLKDHGKEMTGGAGNMVIHSLTRSLGYNISIGGSPTSGHLRGEGVDINSTRGAGPNVLEWLIKNSEDIPNSNYKKIKEPYQNLIWWNHTVNPDGKTGMHIDLKWAE